LNLGGLLWAQSAVEASAPVRPPAPRIRACILIFYYGGPSHLDTFDMKPEAPADIRGEFRAVSTSVPGIQICEHLPETARVMHHVALIRSMHHRNGFHDAASVETLTGRPPREGDREFFAPTPQFYPSYGAALGYVLRHQGIDVPHAVLPWLFHNVVDVPCQGGGFLGTAYEPLLISGDVERNTYRSDTLSLPEGLSRRRVDIRRGLLDDLDTARDVGLSKRTDERLRIFRDKAYSLLSADWLRTALDVERESAGTRRRYGLEEPRRDMKGGVGAENAIGANLRGQNLLLARRLVEAGVPFVNVNDFRQQGQNWDSHARNFQQHRDDLLPPADRAFASLIEDLDQRGLLDSTLVVATGEFGRTPKINRDGGRDHWPDCYSVVLAGGGVKGGYVHGASDRMGAYPVADAVTPADLAATIFWRFGIDPALEIHDPLGRPHRLCDGQPIRELFI
jgi:hypothetical protein